MPAPRVDVAISSSRHAVSWHYFNCRFLLPRSWQQKGGKIFNIFDLLTICFLVEFDFSFFDTCIASATTINHASIIFLVMPKNYFL